MNTKCDSCLNQICEPRDGEQPYGAFYCSKGHWSGAENDDDPEPKEDHWKFCKDYSQNG